jgi:hypothetical protein
LGTVAVKLGIDLFERIRNALQEDEAEKHAPAFGSIDALAQFVGRLQAPLL